AQPFYGGTYFPPAQAYGRHSWGQILFGVSNSFKENRKAIETQAEKLMKHIEQSDKIFLKENIMLSEIPERHSFEKTLQAHYNNLSNYFDKHSGGFGNAPKFPHFSNLLFLLRWNHFYKDESALNHALFSLDKMLQGGIYDQIGGGLSRYATDEAWLIPHFEKMLYDNALLLQTLAEAYQITQRENYKHAIAQTIGFLQREMLSDEGGFYAALDADSEGEEGKFYVWQKKEIDELLKNDSEIFCKYFNVTAQCNWEGKNILNRTKEAQEFAEENKIDVATFISNISNCSEKLLQQRDKRVRPGLDDKIMLGWNALMCSALAKCFQATGIESYKQLALKNVLFLKEKFFNKAENKFYHT